MRTLRKCLVAGLVVLTVCVPVVGAELTPDGRRAVADHAFLFDVVAKKHPTVFAEKADPATGRKRIREILVIDQPFTVDGGYRLALPDDVNRVLNLFFAFELRGEGLDGITKGTLAPVAPNRRMTLTRKGTKRIQLKVSNLPIFDGKRHAFVLNLEGSGRVDRVALVASGGGIPTQLDLAPYQNLGYDRPPRDLAVVVDLTHEQAIEGIIEVDRSKWFRIYGRPNSLPRALEEHVVDKGFLPGRQMVKLRYALEEGHGSRDLKLGENPVKPGWADPAFFNKYRAASFAGVDPDLKFAMCFNYWPSFMSVGGKDVADGRGTPKDYPAAADLVVRYLQNQIQHSGRTATWWEVKNESTIKHEWAWHYVKGVDSWKRLADFHNAVADAVHKNVPGVKIGGPASAWMQVQVGRFKLWNEQRRFMDNTRGHLDFYSHHFYENKHTLGLFDRRYNGYTNYLTGRLDAILDMFRAHMVATDNVKPLLITEYGMLNTGTLESDYWARLRTYNAYLVQFMQRPHQIDLAVPFVSAATPWEPQSGYAIFVPKEGMKPNALRIEDYRRTPNGYFLDFWEGVGGRRVPLRTSDPWLRGVALRDGNRLHIALTNLGNRRGRIDLELGGKEATIESVAQRRCYYFDGKVHFEGNIDRGASLENLPVDVDETTLITVTLKDPIEPQGVVDTRTFYAAETAVPAPEIPKRGFAIQLPDLAALGLQPRNAWLVIGIQRDGGLDAPLPVDLNGHSLQIDTTFSKGVDHFFEPLAVRIPVKQINIAGENRVGIDLKQNDAFVSSVALKLECTVR